MAKLNSQVKIKFSTNQKPMIVMRSSLKRSSLKRSSLKRSSLKRSSLKRTLKIKSTSRYIFMTFTTILGIGTRNRYDECVYYAKERLNGVIKIESFHANNHLFVLLLSHINLNIR
jgi:hypothetical protein